MKHCIIVWGCTSGAGKSLLATALCRWAANRGVDVAPFKAQNMSNNARVVPAWDGRDGGDGFEGAAGEIGSAQYFQALAARQSATVDMNPVLLKPEADTRCQVVVHGRVEPALAQMPWRERAGVLAQAAQAAFERLAARHEVIVIEGAGSPAETNLADGDYVNLGAARWALAHAQAPASASASARRAPHTAAVQALLVADIDSGGAFAHCLGTWTLLPPDLRPLLAGFVLNKFRGDAGLLAPAPADLQRATGVPVLGVLPMWREHGLPDEDGLMAAPPLPPPSAAGSPAVALRIAVIAPPHLSNLDEFQPLQQQPGVALSWVREPAALEGVHWIVLPGSKQVSSDLAWLRTRGLDAAVRAFAAAGRPVLGICGGLQMLGALLSDPEGVDGEAHGALPGLGLLPLATTYAAPKQLRRTSASFAADLQGSWAALAGVPFSGYEIRCGRIEPLPPTHTADSAPQTHQAHQAHPPHAALIAEGGQVIGWSAGSVLGIHAHGLFESPAVQRALFGAPGVPLDHRLDNLAAWLEQHLGQARLAALFGL